MNQDKDLGGRPPHSPTEVTRKNVESMSAVGITQEQIASVIGVNLKTLRKHYRDELDNAATKLNTSIGRRLYDKAMEGDSTALIWWTKARMKWSGEQTIHHTGINIKVEDKEDTEL